MWEPPFQVCALTGEFGGGSPPPTGGSFAPPRFLVLFVGSSYQVGTNSRVYFSTHKVAHPTQPVGCRCAVIFHRAIWKKPKKKQKANDKEVGLNGANEARYRVYTRARIQGTHVGTRVTRHTARECYTTVVSSLTLFYVL